MNLKNTTEFPDYFLRRMVSWCCKQVDLPPSWMRQAQFMKSKRNRGFTGNGGGRSIVVRLGEQRNGGVCGVYHGVKQPETVDRIEDLILITSHEVTHCWQSYKRFRFSETVTVQASHRAVAAFREQRDALLAAWNALPVAKESKPKVSIVERRAAKAFSDLERWSRKLKLAQTKVRKCKQRARYYQQSLAACKGKA